MNKVSLVLIMVFYLASCLWALDWGLYCDEREKYLFPEGSPWSRVRVAQVLEHKEADDQVRGADVDPDPQPPSTSPIVLNESDERVAEMFSRYLLYSNQPDEMITFRALREMDPPAWRLDPKMYQYGGLFIYPVGVLIKLADQAGLLRLGTLSDFLIAPQEFAKFYIVGRAYVMFWGLLGIWIMYAIGKYLADWRAGALSALLFSVLPVVVSLSHESKPHLPGAVLMLWAVLWALKYVETGQVKHRLMLALACGLSVGMVLSSLWIVILIPLAEMLTRSTMAERVARSLVFGLIAGAVYCLTNPYILINVVTNPAILESNFGNSVDMYRFGNLAVGLANAFALMVEGSSIFVVVAGAAMLIALWGWDWRQTAVLAVPCVIVFAQFAALAAGKPGEYGRFGIFPNAILCAMLAAGLFRFMAQKWYQGTIYSLAIATTLAWPSLNYLESLHFDGSKAGSRYRLASHLHRDQILDRETQTASYSAIGVLRAPAPYGFPPLDFGARPIALLPKEIADWPTDCVGWPRQLVVPAGGLEGVDLDAILSSGCYKLDGSMHQALPADPSPITWANRPLVLLVHR